MDVATVGGATASIFFGNGDGSFQSPNDYSLPSPRGIRIADVDGDGALDLAVASQNTLSILINRGNGLFKPKVDYVDSGTFFDAEAFALIDINQDGKPDWLANRYTGQHLVSVLLNGGDGTFKNAVTYSANSYGGLATGDFNGDNVPDLALGGTYPAVRINNGDGSFAAEQKINGFSSRYVYVADVDGDRTNDLLEISGKSSTNYTTTVALGTGAGTFKPVISTQIRENLGGFAVGPGNGSPGLLNDFNQDGLPDLLLPFEKQLALIQNKGDGLFQSEAPSTDPGAFGAGVNAITLVDVDGDHKLDVLYTKGYNSDGTLAVALGNGDGTLKPAVGYALRNSPDGLISGDLNGDGHPDIAVSYGLLTDNHASVLFNYGDGTFLPRTDYKFGTAANGLMDEVTLGDIDNDNDLDLAFAAGTYIGILRNTGQGLFQIQAEYKHTAYDVAFADLDNNQTLDLVAGVANGKKGNVLLFNKGDGSFPLQQDMNVGSNAVAVADIEGDGRPDIATTDYNSDLLTGSLSISVVRNLGDGRFDNQVDLTTTRVSQNHAMLLADLNGDERPELVVSDDTSGVGIFSNNGDGTFGGKFSYLVGYGNSSPAYSIAAGDMNGDGKTDLVAAAPGHLGGRITVLLNDTDFPALTFDSVPTFAAQALGKSSPAETLTLTNRSPDNLTLGSLAVSGDFALSANSCGVTLAKGASCTVQIKFTPTALGTRSGKLSVKVIGEDQPYALNLTGLGVKAIYPLNVTVNGNGTVSSNPQGISCPGACSHDFASDTLVTLSAKPTAQNSFIGWGGECSGTGDCQVKMSAARKVTANFVADNPNKALLTVVPGGTGSGSVKSKPSGIDCGKKCAYQFPVNQVVILTAKPTSNSVFSGWGGACSGTGNCSVTLNAAKNVTAAFSTAILTVTNQTPTAGSISGNGISCGQNCAKAFKPGTKVTLKAKPTGKNKFTGWSGACTGTTATCSLLLDDDKSVSASFAP